MPEDENYVEIQTVDHDVVFILAYHLDSGTQRGEAHKFYFNQGFTITSYHFSEQLQNGV